MPSTFAFIGRLLLSLLFLVSGANKLMMPATTEAMITGVGLPAGMAIPVGVFEVVAGLALVFGILTRVFALLLAAFCLLSAFFFHNNFADPVQAAMLLKNVAIAGGLLCLCAVSTMRWSFDERRDRKRADAARLEADRRAHDAELRAARAEGQAQGLRTTPLAPGAVTTGVAPHGTTVTDVNGDGVPEVRRKRFGIF